MPNTQPVPRAQQPRHPDDFEIIADTSKPTKADENIAALQSRLQSEIDGRKEERFGWGLAFAIVLDALIFHHTSWPVTIFLGLLQLIFLAYFATLCGVDRVIVPFDRLFNKLLALLPGKDNDKP